MKSKFTFLILMLLVPFISAHAQCSSFNNSITNVSFNNSNCNNTPSTSVVSVTYNISLTTGNASFKYGYILNGTTTYLPSNFINVQGSTNIQYQHQITMPCSGSISFFITAWSAPNGNGSQCTGSNASITTPSFSPQGQLPVKIASFTITEVRDNIVLSWLAENEINILGYEIEKSTNGTQWTSASFVSRKTNNNPSNTYVFTDIIPTHTIYYRLKQIESNNQNTFSQIIAFSQKPQNILFVCPNPSDGIFKVNELSKYEKSEVILMNQTGMIVQLTLQDETLDLRNYPDGIYYLKILSTNDCIKIIKQE